MSDTAPHTSALEPPALTIWAALRRPEQWWQLIQFGLVGSSGFVVNFAVYAVCLKGFGLHYLASACIAFCVAVANNFLLNRLWTFRKRRDDAPRGRTGGALPGRLRLRARARTC